MLGKEEREEEKEEMLFNNPPISIFVRERSECYIRPFNAAFNGYLGNYCCNCRSSPSKNEGAAMEGWSG